jgi:radical SAM superfamily enzyme YgiQ (UPF0313 family)
LLGNKVSWHAMADIVLSTLNAKYIHTAFGLRSLLANLGSLRAQTALLEFDIHRRPIEVAESLLSQRPKIIGLGVYIWNVAALTEVVGILKRVRPEVIVILGGPEVSWEAEEQPIVQMADCVITGEGELRFAEVCAGLLGNGSRESWSQSLPKIISAEPPEFAQLVLPYSLYSEEDIAHRMVYVESSRGCPFDCEFCLSSRDVSVRQVDLAVFLGEMQGLLERGVRQFKFVDRSFNLNVAAGRAILEFFLDRHRAENLYHFEMIPDRLPTELREVIVKFPPGSLQFEVGIQTFNPEVAQRIRRRQDLARLEENFRFLRQETGVHIHADLIFGLPGESLESFGAGFDRLVALGPQEIQVGILKRLRGTPIVRHDLDWQMVYNSHPPYEILQNRLVDFGVTQQMRRFARYWDLVGNSGNFVGTAPLIWGDGSPFRGFLRWSEWLHSRVGRTDSIALVRLMELLFEYLTGELKLDPAQTASAMGRDYSRGNRPEVPGFLKVFISADAPRETSGTSAMAGARRQARHLALRGSNITLP